MSFLSSFLTFSLKSSQLMTLKVQEGVHNLSLNYREDVHNLSLRSQECPQLVTELVGGCPTLGTETPGVSLSIPLARKITNIREKYNNSQYRKVNSVSSLQFLLKDTPGVSVPRVGHPPMSSVTSCGHSCDLSDKLWTSSR